MLEAFNPDNAPKVLGPYSHAIRAGDFLYVSGQLPINPQSGQIESLDIEAQTEQVLKNVETILKAAGAKFENVARCDIFLKNLRDFSKVNSIYGDCFKGPAKPARQTVEVSKLPLDALIEISCIAYLPS
jgi:2-iminobutanoate/2-iminopropanoate deaminase